MWYTVNSLNVENDESNNISDNLFSIIGEARLYETGDGKCPINAFLLYFPKLNLNLNGKGPGQFSIVTPLGEKYVGGIFYQDSAKSTYQAEFILTIA